MESIYKHDKQQEPIESVGIRMISAPFIGLVLELLAAGIDPRLMRTVLLEILGSL